MFTGNRFAAQKGSIGLQIDGQNIVVNHGAIISNSFSGTGIMYEGIDPGNNPSCEVIGNTGIQNYSILPYATTIEINEIISPPTGYQVLNTTENKIAYFDGAAWRLLSSTVMHTTIFFEDFEGTSGITWNYVQSNSVNDWNIGTAAGSGPSSPTTGTKCAYISNNAGVSWAYKNNDTGNSHMYTDITIPAGVTSVQLSFDWKGFAESGYDWLEVFDAPTTYTPPSTTEVSSTYLIGGPYNDTSAWQTVGLTIDPTEIGTTRRFIFSWRNDSSVGDEPSAIDNIKINTLA
jgi:hypothetical protein